MIALCIAERYYISGLFRIEYFPTEAHLRAFQAKLDRGVTSWMAGEPMPKRKVLGEWQ